MGSELGVPPEDLGEIILLAPKPGNDTGFADSIPVTTPVWAVAAAKTLPRLTEREDFMYRPSWQLPPGVHQASWDYMQSTAIAREYNQDLAEHPLFQLDLQLVKEHLGRGSPSSAGWVVADLGCGTGRVAHALLPLGHRVLNIDLSQAMFDQFEPTSASHENSFRLRANLAELGCLKDHSLDMAVCLFSSFGMIRGREHRASFLAHVRRCLRPGCSCIVHAHNRYHSLQDPGGILWLLRSRISSLTGGNEFGDRWYAYRGLPRMYLHIFSRRELIREFQAAGFSQIEILPVKADCTGWLPVGQHLPDLHAGSFFAVACCPE